MRVNRFFSAALACMLACTLILTGCGEKKAKKTDSAYTLSSGWENPISAPRPESDFLPEVENIGPQLDSFIAQNADVVGWLQVPGTTISEAVVQAEDNEYYYRRDVNKQYSYSGSLWMDMDCSLGEEGTAEEPEKFSQNLIIYGHNLGNPTGVQDDPNGVKFAQLLKFGEVDFAREHPYFFFTTSSGTYTYEIFAVFYCEDVTKPVAYHHADFKVSDFRHLLSDVRNRSQFNYNVTVRETDKIMTLSTCSYKYGTYAQNPHQRFVVMGKQLDKDAAYYPTADLEQNATIKEPQF